MTTRTAATPSLRAAGDSALLIELEPVIEPDVNAHAIAIAGAIRSAALQGVRDVVCTYRSVAVYFDPLLTTAAALGPPLRNACEVPSSDGGGNLIEVPIIYGGEYGPDLDAVAARAGLSEAQAADRHCAGIYRVFMLGFLPGFAYMASVDPAIAVPRHAAPRMLVPAGSVGIAGRQTGIYPFDSPGGWQLIGWTPARVFDPERHPRALLSAGDRVRFIRERTPGGPRPAVPRQVAAAPLRASGNALTVLAPGLFTTVQDAGRWGHQGEGVSVSGPMDPWSHRVANMLVGNPPEAATLEATMVGPELRFEQAGTFAVAGADLSATLDGSAIGMNERHRCRPGSVLRIAHRRRGARAYVGVRGGIDVPPVLGSRSTHVLGILGGRPLRAGDRIPLGPASAEASVPAWRRDHRSPLPIDGGARLRVIRGPQDALFAPAALDMLQSGRFQVSPHSNRMAYRLTGTVLPAPAGEMISDATFTGAIQVPPSGEPILLMADRQTVGGYPQIATVITADLPRAGQLAPGDWVEFEICTPDVAIAALHDQEALLASH